MTTWRTGLDAVLCTTRSGSNKIEPLAPVLLTTSQRVYPRAKS